MRANPRAEGPAADPRAGGPPATFAGPREERRAEALLVVALVVAAAILLYLNRGTTFFRDELTWITNASDLHGFESVLTPHNSHLIGTTRLAYTVTLHLFGPDYLVMRVLGVAGVLLTATLFFVWAKRRIGPGWALLPSILLLFYGSAWWHVVGPIGFTVTFSIALGLGALIAAEGGGRRNDLLACGLITLSVFTYTVGLAYLIGVGISILLGRDRLRRAWIFLVPLALYTAWWVWAQHFDQGRTELVGLVGIVEFFAASMVANSSAITGIDFPSGSPPVASPTVLSVLAGVALSIALAWRVIKGRIPHSFWVSLGVLVTFWLAAAIADVQPEGSSQAYAIRYLFPGSTALLLVLVDAVRGVRIRGRWAYGLLAVFAFSLVMNLIFLRDGAAYLRDQGQTARIQLAMLELRGGLDPGGNGSTTPPELTVPSDAAVPEGTFPGQYLETVARYGSPAMTLTEVAALSYPLRRVADSALAADGGIAVLPLADGDQPRHPRHCRVLEGGAPTAFDPGLVYVRSLGGAPAELTANRFSDPPGITIGTVPPGRWSVLAVAEDRSPRQWSIALPETARMRACRIAPSG